MPELRRRKARRWGGGRRREGRGRWSEAEIGRAHV